MKMLFVLFEVYCIDWVSRVLCGVVFLKIFFILHSAGQSSQFHCSEWCRDLRVCT